MACARRAHLGVRAVAQHDIRHVDRALVVRDHAGGEVAIGIAGVADGHVAVHAVVGGAEFAGGGGVLRVRAAGAPWPWWDGCAAAGAASRAAARAMAMRFMAVSPGGS